MTAIIPWLQLLLFSSWIDFDSLRLFPNIWTYPPSKRTEPLLLEDVVSAVTPYYEHVCRFDAITVRQKTTGWDRSGLARSWALSIRSWGLLRVHGHALDSGDDKRSTTCDGQRMACLLYELGFGICRFVRPNLKHGNLYTYFTTITNM